MPRYASVSYVTKITHLKTLHKELENLPVPEKRFSNAITMGVHTGRTSQYQHGDSHVSFYLCYKDKLL